jgi:flagellar hook-associated protein 1 FlgK
VSLASLLSIARSALLVHQRAMDVTGHNVANANTPGYSRQTLQLQAAAPLVLPRYSVGRGVDAAQVTRSRDAFYDAAYRRDNGMFGQSGTLNDYLGQIEASLNEPSDSGLSASLDGMFRSLADLANDPASHTNRELVVSAANRMTQQMHSLAGQLGRISQEAVDNLRTQVDQVNGLATRIAGLNEKIVASGGVGGSPDLMDQRDMLVDQVSQLMNVRVLERADGTIGLSAGDTMLVDGGQAATLAVGSVGSGWGIVPAAGGAAIDPQSGSLKALLDLVDTRVPAVSQKLDQLASALVTEFNNVHRTGYTPAGVTNVDFFDPAGVTASSIQLSAAVSGSSDNIAASGNNTPGNGDVVSRLAGLATTGVASLGGRTFREHFVSLAASIGIDVSSSGQDLAAHQTLVDRDQQARNATSGVNVDEEMIALITQQQAYQASARLVTVAEQMITDLMNIL